MAAKKFIRLVSGRLQEIIATVVSAGAANDGDIPALDASGRLDTSVMPVGVVADTKSVVSSESLTAGDFVNVYNNAGTLNVRKADATTSGKEAHGFVLASVTFPAAATVYFEGINTQRSALTVGAKYYLDTTAGGVVAAPPAASGNVVQYIGTALSATELNFEADTGVILA